MTCLISPLMHVFAKDEKKFQKIQCIKRGTGYMEIKYNNLIFRDFYNYSTPMSLGTVITHQIMKKYLK